MKEKILFVVIVGVVVMSAVYSIFFDTTEEEFYLKTVVYKDSDNMLIPVSLNFYNEMDIEQEVVNRIDMMKSDEFSSKGLYPILNEELEVNYVDLIDNVLTIDFNDELYVNDSALDVIEALSFTLLDYEEVNELNLTIDGESIHYIPNSNIPVSALNSSIGLNNFSETDELLHHTYPVMIYHTKSIDDYEYFVPITTRISEKDSLDEQVTTILNLIDNSIILKEVVLNDGILNIVLDSSVLLEDGTIDKNLYNQLSLTFSSINNIDSITIEVDNEEIINESVTSTQINYIKI